MTRPQVITFQSNPTDAQVRAFKDEAQRVLGRISALCDFQLYQVPTGIAGTSGTAPGTKIPSSQLAIDFADAGLDFLRVQVVATGTANHCRVNIVKVSTLAVLCSVTLDARSQQLAVGNWTQYTSGGGDETVAIYVQDGSNGHESITLYAVHLQGATLNAKP